MITLSKQAARSFKIYMKLEGDKSYRPLVLKLWKPYAHERRGKIRIKDTKQDRLLGPTFDFVILARVYIQKYLDVDLLEKNLGDEIKQLQKYMSKIKKSYSRKIAAAKRRSNV